MAEVIAGKVAKIIDEYSLIINVGRKDGVSEGMVFVVYAEGDEVKDPDTGRSLGKWEIIKGRIVAAHVQELLSMCSARPVPPSDKDVDPRTQTLSAAMIAVSLASGERTRGPRLNVSKADISGMPAVGPIGVGDRVRSVEAPSI